MTNAVAMLIRAAEKITNAFHAGGTERSREKQLEPEKLKDRYPEFRQYEGKCRFRECLHDREPGCAVTNAVNQGMLNARRVERYRQLLGETREVWRARYD